MGVLIVRGLLFGVSISAPDFLKLPCIVQLAHSDRGGGMTAADWPLTSM